MGKASSFAVARRRHPLIRSYRSKRQPAFLESVLDPFLPSRAFKKQRVYTRRMFDDDEEDDDLFSTTTFSPASFSSQQQKQGYDLIDNADKFELRLDVPGVKQDDICIKIDDDKNLTVKGTRVYETETAKSKSKFKRMFSLDKAVDVDRFSATMTNGVLVVSAPKRNQQLLKDSRKIPIVCVDDGAVAVTEHKNSENKQSKDSKDDSFKNVDQGNGKKDLNSEDNGTKRKDENHDDDIMKAESHASKHSADKKSEENTNESAK